MLNYQRVCENQSSEARRVVFGFTATSRHSGRRARVLGDGSRLLQFNLGQSQGAAGASEVSDLHGDLRRFPWWYRQRDSFLRENHGKSSSKMDGTHGYPHDFGNHIVARYA